MQLLLKRSEFNETCTLGQLFIDGAFFCYTLEDKVREEDGKSVSEWKIDKVTAIPRGVYKLVLDFSNRFQKIMPHILDVPGFTGIRMHSGNVSEETEGCPLVGATLGQNSIHNSKLAFESLMAKLQGRNDMTIEIC